MGPSAGSAPVPLCRLRASSGGGLSPFGSGAGRCRSAHTGAWSEPSRSNQILQSVKWPSKGFASSPCIGEPVSYTMASRRALAQVSHLVLSLRREGVIVERLVFILCSPIQNYQLSRVSSRLTFAAELLRPVAARMKSTLEP